MANSFLSPGDEALVRLGLGVVRWMDDTWAFLGSTDDPRFVEQVYDANLRSLGLSVNGDKTYFAEGPMAEFVVRDAFLDSVTKGGDSRIDEDEALAILMTAVEDDGVAVAWPWVRFALGALRGHRSGAALEVLQDRSDLFMEEPKAVGDYLEAVAEGSDRRQLDKDWLVELATVPCSERGVSRRIHACRCPSQCQGCEHVEQQPGARCDHRQQPPVGSATLERSCIGARGEGWKAAAAVDRAVDGTSDFSVRRSLVAGLKQRHAFDSPRAAAWREQAARSRAGPRRPKRRVGRDR